MQMSSEGRHRAARHSQNSRHPEQATGKGRLGRAWAARHRRFAVLALVALVGTGSAYHGEIQRAILASSSSRLQVPLLGSSVQNRADLAADTAAFGRMPIVRVYYSGLPDSNAWTTGMAQANHSAVIVSFKARPTTILSGADDAALRHFFDTAPFGRPIYYSYFHEPEDNIAAGQFKLSDYKAAWARVVAIAKAAHNPYLHSTLILMSWDLVRSSHRNWRNYLPAGGIISTLGWDAYPQGSAENVHPQLTPPSVFMGRAIAASKSVGLPYGFPEFGLSTPRGRPGWLAAVGRYIMHSGALFASYFNGNRQYPTLRLTDARSIAVWRSFVAASRSGIPVPQPSPTGSPGGPPSPSPGLHVTGLVLSPATMSRSNQANAALRFHLSQKADITVCILNSNGTIVRTLARPGKWAGTVVIRYLALRHPGPGLAAGRYTILVVASNARGSATAASPLTIR